MAKIVFIPNWLRETFAETGKPLLETLATKNVNSSILSKYDVINYHKAQIEFFKFIVGETYDTVEEFSYKFSQAMWNNISSLPEITIYMSEHYASDVNFELIDCYPIFETFNSSDITGISKYTVKGSSDNKITYIIGGPVASNILNALPTATVEADRISITYAILDKSYSGFRITSEGTDRSSVFRENDFLTQLYVKNLCNA